MKRLIALLALAVVSAAQAAPVTIDFNSYTTISPDQVDSLGYTFRIDDVVPGGMTVTTGFVGTPADTGNVLGYQNSSITFARADGGLFNLESLDVYHWWAYSVFDSNHSPYTVTGVRADGTQVQISSNGLANFSLHTLSPAWTNLESVKVSTSFDVNGELFIGAIDNVVVTNVVPLPPAVYLFGSALVWLAARRRPRQTN